MPEVIVIRVPSVPSPQPRQRTRVVCPKGKKPFATNYTPKDDKSHTLKASIRDAASKAYTGPPLQGPLRVDVDFVFPRPGNLFWKTKPMPRLWHIKKPDRDNTDKVVGDALSKLIWRDDSQLCDGRLRKFIAAGDEQPHLLITITCLEDECDV